MRKARLIEDAENDVVHGNGREQIRALCERARFQSEWYSVRWKRLHEYLRDHADQDTFERSCNIMANGTADSMEPPTYGQILNVLQQAIEQSIALADTGSHAHKSRFDPDGVGEIPPGWRVVEAMTERLKDGLKWGTSLMRRSTSTVD